MQKWWLYNWNNDKINDSQDTFRINSKINYAAPAAFRRKQFPLGKSNSPNAIILRIAVFQADAAGKYWINSTN